MEAGRSSFQGVVELVGELFVLPAVGFAQHLSHPAHGAPGRTEQRRAD